MAFYPDELKTFTKKQDNVDTVVANDVNLAYSEIEEIVRQLGIGGVTTSAWGTGTFTTSTTTWYGANGGLKGRLTNIEKGLWDLTQIIDGFRIGYECLFQFFR
jgi:hypothetical protein